MPRRPIEMRGLNDFVRRLAQIGEDLFTKELFDEISLYVISQIQIRTAEGEDVHGRPFAPYSASYARVRARAGRPVDKVDLFFHGEMMAAMDFDASERGARIFFRSATDKSGTSIPAKAFWLHEDREFFAISVEEQEEILELVNEYVERVLREGEER